MENNNDGAEKKTHSEIRVQNGNRHDTNRKREKKRLTDTHKNKLVSILF